VKWGDVEFRNGHGLGACLLDILLHLRYAGVGLNTFFMHISSVSKSLSFFNIKIN
jgi:hypothetical protein